MNKWEYKIIKINGLRAYEIETLFNDLGNDGWELVLVLHWHAFFKRQKQDGKG